MNQTNLGACMFNSKYILNFTNNNNIKSRQVSIPKFFKPLYLGIKAVVLIGFCLFVVEASVFAYHFYAKQTAFLKKASLFKESKDLSKKLSEYETKLEHLNSDDDRLRLKFGFKPIDPNIKQQGIGGRMEKEDVFDILVYPHKQQEQTLKNQIGHLERQVALNQKMYPQLQYHLEQKYNSWRFIPSVYPAKGHVSSHYGYRIHPITKQRKLHDGMDISNKEWTPIYAPADGVVEYVKKGPFFGNYVAINHQNGYKTVFGHLKKANVKPGEFVQRYQVIAFMGNTGRSTGSHLHYEVHKNGKPINPRDFILPPNYSVD